MRPGSVASVPERGYCEGGCGISDMQGGKKITAKPTLSSVKPTSTVSGRRAAPEQAQAPERGFPRGLPWPSVSAICFPGEG